jgi:hypothetical protein
MHRLERRTNILSTIEFNDEQQRAKHASVKPSASSQTLTMTIDQVNHHSDDATIDISMNEQQARTADNVTNLDRKHVFNLSDFGRDFTYETLAHLSRSSNDIAMSLCEDTILIYAQHCNQLVIVSVNDPVQANVVHLNMHDRIKDLCYVAWLGQCLVITNENIYLVDYRTARSTCIESGMNYISGVVDNQHEIFYLVQQTTLHKYDSNSLINLQADQYPIADGYQARYVTLDNRSNTCLALLVVDNETKNYVFVYSTLSLADGFLYKIMIDDCIDRHWICSNGNNGWLIRATDPGSCLDLNIDGLGSVRMFDVKEIRHMIPMHEHQRFLLRTETEIFVLMKAPCFTQTF